MLSKQENPHVKIFWVSVGVGIYLSTETLTAKTSQNVTIVKKKNSVNEIHIPKPKHKNV